MVNGRAPDIPIDSRLDSRRKLRGTISFTVPTGHTPEGGKAPAAICRKMTEAKLSGRDQIEVWGHGEQSRSFSYIGYCVHEERPLTDSDVTDPVNVGSSEFVSVIEAVDLLESIADLELRRRCDLTAPPGFRGRNGDSTLVTKLLDSKPSALRDDLERPYAWIYDDMCASRAHVAG